MGAVSFGSVCSGIEAASVAWNPIGWEAAWLSEIEPFPSAVLRHHYPDVPNLGDMTLLPARISSGEVEAPDVFCGGTPCQAFSVAGLRKSLDDKRGNLSLTFCEIANEIDTARSIQGRRPAIIFWENVPGVLSTKDNAFGCFLAGLAGEDEALEPPGGKWTNAGCVFGPKRAVAWRVLDAQYFGVAQRRRRVFVVASARDDFDPAAVLFEFDGLRRDSAPSRQAGEATATSAGAGAAGRSWPAEVSCTLDTTFGTKQGLEDQHVNAGCPMFVPGPAVTQFGDIAGTMTARHDSSPCADRGLNVVAQPMPINTMVALRHEALGRGTGFGIGEAGDPAYTLTKGHSHAVAQPIAFHPTQDPISSADGTTHGLGCGSSGGQASVAVAFGVGEQQEVGHCLRSGASKADKHESTTYAVQAMQVRRLTPVECSRLQGFSDDYLTQVPWRNKPTPPDGPMYKALGNSWAVPVVRWIGQRIDACL